MWNRMVFALLEIVAAALFLIPAMALLNQVRFHSVRKTLAYCVVLLLSGRGVFSGWIALYYVYPL